MYNYNNYIILTDNLIDIIIITIIIYTHAIIVATL